MSDIISLTDHLLIAMPGLEDPNFYRSVTYICEHNSEGAMGIVINRPLELKLGEVLSHMSIQPSSSRIAESPVFLGGPVETDRGFVLHQPLGDWETTLSIAGNIGVTTSGDILKALALDAGPAKILVALGYAGWGAGQLEEEMAGNVWLSTPADYKILFETPWSQRWAAAVALMGIDLSQLSDKVGHA